MDAILNLIIKTIRKIARLVFNLKYRSFRVKRIYYKLLFKELGNNVKIFGDFSLHSPDKIKIGDGCSINDSVYLNGKGCIDIGRNVSLSAGCLIVSTMLDKEQFLVKKSHISKKIIIADNVQVGAGATILPGVRIGENVIIGAGAVVTKDIPRNTIAVGVPARIVGSIENAKN